MHYQIVRYQSFNYYNYLKILFFLSSTKRKFSNPSFSLFEYSLFKICRFFFIFSFRNRRLKNLDFGQYWEHGLNGVKTVNPKMLIDIFEIFSVSKNPICLRDKERRVIEKQTRRNIKKWKRGKNIAHRSQCIYPRHTSEIFQKRACWWNNCSYLKNRETSKSS